MQKRPLQSITLKLSDLEEYEAVRRNRKNKAALDACRPSSVTETATETAPSTSSETSEIPVTQRDLLERPTVPDWLTAERVSSNTYTISGSTEDDISAAAVVDDADTIAELSDDGWIDIDDEDGARGEP